MFWSSQDHFGVSLSSNADFSVYLHTLIGGGWRVVLDCNNNTFRKERGSLSFCLPPPLQSLCIDQYQNITGSSTRSLSLSFFFYLKGKQINFFIPETSFLFMMLILSRAQTLLGQPFAHLSGAISAILMQKKDL